MRSFWIKVINLAMVCGLLVCYQQFAFNRQKEVDAYETKLAEMKKQEAAGSRKYKDGTYEGSGTGFGGEIRVQVRIADGVMQSAQVTESKKETPEYLASAQNLLKDVIATQSTEVDTVSGATLSSNGILAAVRQALDAAGGSGEKEG